MTKRLYDYEKKTILSFIIKQLKRTCIYMKLRLPFRHHELFYYNKKLFIHYFLVPGRQVPFLVREGPGPQGPYSNYAYAHFPTHNLYYFIALISFHLSNPGVLEFEFYVGSQKLILQIRMALTSMFGFCFELVCPFI